VAKVVKYNTDESGRQSWSFEEVPNLPPVDGQEYIMKDGSWIPKPVSITGGVDGKSAYELAVDNGFIGTVQEWLLSLDGKDGQTGQPGYTPIKNVDYFDGIQGLKGDKGNGFTNTSVPTSATTGTMTVVMDSDIKTITPTGACTFNASGGTIGNIITFHITTSGTTSRVLTFGTNFRKTTTLSTGTTSGRFFSITFRCIDGTIWSEICRTAVLT